MEKREKKSSLTLAGVSDVEVAASSFVFSMLLCVLSFCYFFSCFSVTAGERYYNTAETKETRRSFPWENTADIRTRSMKSIA